MRFTRQQNSTAHPIAFKVVLSSDHVSPATGKTLTLKLLKDGGTTVTASGAITEGDATNNPGVYQWAGNATDRNTLGDVVGTITGTGCDNADIIITVVPWDPFAANLSADAKAINGNATAASNLALLMNRASGTATAGTATTITLQTALGADNICQRQAIHIISGTGAGQTRNIASYVDATRIVTVDRAWVMNPDATSIYVILPGDLLKTNVNGDALPTYPIRKNTAVNNYEFSMGVDGLTVTGTVSIDGAAPISLTNAISPVGGGTGLYKINLAAADLNGNIVTLIFAATGALTRKITIPLRS